MFDTAPRNRWPSHVTTTEARLEYLLDKYLEVAEAATKIEDIQALVQSIHFRFNLVKRVVLALKEQNTEIRRRHRELKERVTTLEGDIFDIKTDLANITQRLEELEAATSSTRPAAKRRPQS